MAMRKLGEVVRTAQGLAVLRCPGADHPDIGTMAVDDQLTTVGRVVDVFGPVERPYVAVTPDDGTNPATLLGENLYAQ